MAYPFYLIEPDLNERHHIQAILTTEVSDLIVFENVESLFARVDLSKKGCLIASAALPGPGILALLMELERRRSALSVIVLDRNTAFRTIVAIMQAGAFDFVEPSFNDWRLVAVVHRLTNGGALHNGGNGISM